MCVPKENKKGIGVSGDIEGLRLVARVAACTVSGRGRHRLSQGAHHGFRLAKKKKKNVLRAAC